MFIGLSRKDFDAIAGTYLTTRRADSTRLKLEDLFSQHSVKVDKDGILHVEDVKDLRGHPIKWKPIAKDLWQAIDGQQRLFAIRDIEGKVVRLAYDFPGVQAERVPWYENSKLVLSAAGGSLAVLAMVLIASLSRLCRRIFLRKRSRPSPQPGTKWLPFVSQAAAWVWVGMASASSIFFAATRDDLLPPTPAWDKYLFLIDVVTVLALSLSLFAIFSGIRVWRRTGVRRITQVKFTLVAVACLLLSWVAIHWNLLGPVKRI